MSYILHIVSPHDAKTNYSESCSGRIANMLPFFRLASLNIYKNVCIGIGVKSRDFFLILITYHTTTKLHQIFIIVVTVLLLHQIFIIAITADTILIFTVRHITETYNMK